MHQIWINSFEMFHLLPKAVENTETEWKKAETVKNSEALSSNRTIPSKPQPLPQNGTTQPLEPSTAVAAVTVTSSIPTAASGSNPATKSPNPLPSSTSPAGGVPFPLSLLQQQEQFTPTSTKTTVESQVLSPKYGPAYLRDTEQQGASESPHLQEVTKSKRYYSSSNDAWQGRFETFDKNVSKAESVNGPHPNDRLNVGEDKRSVYHRSHEPYDTQIRNYPTNKYVQDDAALIKYRNQYPKDRTYDFLRKSESQRKVSSSKAVYSQDKSVNDNIKQQSHSSLNYISQNHHHHSKHKTVDYHDKNSYNKYVDVRNSSSTNPYKISKDSRRTDSVESIYKNSTVGHSSERLSSSNDHFVGYSKYAPNEQLNNSNNNNNNAIRDKWTESYYRGYHGVRSDHYSNANYQLIGNDKKYADTSKLSSRDNFYPPNYKKWTDGVIKENSTYYLGYAKGESDKRNVKNYSTSQQEENKYVTNWNYSSGYSHHKGYLLEDSKYSNEYKQHIKNSKHDYVPKPTEDVQNSERKHRADDIVTNAASLCSKPALSNSSNPLKSEKILDYTASNDKVNLTDSSDGSLSSSVNRSFSYLSVTKPFGDSTSALPSSTSTSTPLTTAVTTFGSNFSTTSFSTIYSSTTDTLKLSWSAPNPTTSLLSSSTTAHDSNVETTARESRSSSHGSSNGSVSSLSQQSHFLISTGDPGTTATKDKVRERTNSGSSVSNRSRSNSSNDTPSVTNIVSSSVSTPTSTSSSLPTSSASSYETSGSLTSLVFSKPSWNSSGSSFSFTSGAQQPTSVSLVTPRSSSPVPLSGHSGGSLFGLPPQGPSPQLTAGTSPYYSGGSQVMFTPSLVPTGSFLSASLQAGAAPSAAAAASSPVFGGEALFPPPSQDLLRRELDTRFLASHDRSINIPPPPYMRTEMHQHQHQHTHMHQHSPFLPPPLGAPLMHQSAAHLYDKFPKLDSPFYGRSSIGIPGYPSLSPFLAPNAAAAATPFGPPGPLAAFQPKANSIIKTKNLKPGRWCAMHVRIAWEIYHHQQKQQQVESHKGSNASIASLAAASKSPTDLLHPSNPLFGSLPKPHDLAFSSSIFSAASRICLPPLARPTYPTFGPPANSFGGLGGLGLTGAGLFGSKELGHGMIPGDPWSRLHRTPPNFPSPSTSSSSSWGGLKAEAERERERLQQRDEQEKERQKKAEKEKKEKEIEKSKELSRDKREHEKQKERDRELRGYHVTSNPDLMHNGEFSERNRERDRHWERPRERREASRSPIRSLSIPKNDSAFESNNKSKQDIKVKEEKKETESTEPGRESTELRTKCSENTRPESQTSNHSVSNITERPHGIAPPALGCAPSTERSPMPHFWGSLPPAPVLPTNSASLAMNEHYRSLELLRENEREQLLQKYGPALASDRLREAELSRQSASYEAVDRQLQIERERQLYVGGSKLIPPPLRNDMTSFVPPLGLTSTPPASGLFPFTNSFLNSYCGSNLPPPPSTKTTPPGNIGNGIPPPPLIPCGPLDNPNNSSAPNHSSATVRSSPLAHHKSSSERGSPAETYKDIRDTCNPSREAESQSR